MHQQEPKCFQLGSQGAILENQSKTSGRKIVHRLKPLEKKKK